MPETENTAPAEPGTANAQGPDASPEVSDSTTPGAPEVSDDPETDSAAAGEAKIIVSVAPMAQSEFVVLEKPALEQVLAALPAMIEVRLSDDTTAQAGILWACADYASDAPEYRFTSALSESDYVLAEGVSLPTILLRIERPTELTSGDFTCSIGEDGSLVVTGYAGDAEVVNIPASLENRSVVGIAASAFSENEKIRELTVPDGVVSIESGAFRNCAALQKISLPDSLEQLGGGIFEGCNALKTVRLDVSGETVMTSTNSYTRRIVEVIDGVESVRMVSVQIEPAFTDFCVMSGGCWRIEGALRIEKEHSATIGSGGSVFIAQGSSVVVLGALSCAGTSENAGRIIACSGSVSGMSGEIVRDHDWADGICSVCGERQTISLGVEVLKKKFEKVYDGTSGIDIGAEDFRLTGVRDGDEVYIAAVNLNFCGKDVGNYLANASFELMGESAAYYAVKPVEISISITKKTVTVTPRAGQKKAYGAADPVISASYSGVVKGETLKGVLSREKGENAGQYKILAGTLERSNPNYEIALSNAYFEITQRSISDSAITVAKIPNQRYTGEERTPAVEIRDGTRILKAGQDFTVTYSENTQVGSARVNITGTGNYTGSREAGFRIIEVSSGSGGSGLATPGFGGSSSEESSGVSLDDLNHFAGETTDEGEEGVLTLSLDGADYGSILFDEDGNAQRFVRSERLLSDENALHRILGITAVEKQDENGESIEGEYGQPRLRLSLGLIAQLQNDGYTDVELVVGEAEIRIPLSTLYAEYVAVDGTLRVEHYEARLWPVAEAQLSEQEQSVIDGHAVVTQPVHFEMLAVTAQEDDPAAEAEDVLSLLDGVQLLFVPAETPDYQGTRYEVLSAAIDDPGVIHAPEGAKFIMDNDQVKCCCTPVFGGMYALAVEQEAEYDSDQP
ncbi:MAG: MBG domain-containing protein [Candidatus Faecivicinus sp.]